MPSSTSVSTDSELHDNQMKGTIMTDVRQAVREQYGKIGAACGRGCTSSCCSPTAGGSTACGDQTSADIGYSQTELADLPEGANLGLGCGNPPAIAALNEGETVLDLGSGGGIDCFLAARQVGPAGKVIGVDMTAEMIERAREAAKSDGAQNVEFRLGEIEHLPVADQTVDVILSNCVVNLSPDKPDVFRETFRVLKSGGRITISDIVATAPLPDEIRGNIELHVGCMAGAATVDELQSMLADAGFTDIRIDIIEASREAIRQWLPDSGLDNYVASANIQAVRP